MEIHSARIWARLGGPTFKVIWVYMVAEVDEGEADGVSPVLSERLGSMTMSFQIASSVTAFRISLGFHPAVAARFSACVMSGQAGSFRIGDAAFFPSVWVMWRRYSAALARSTACTYRGQRLAFRLGVADGLRRGNLGPFCAQYRVQNLDGGPGDRVVAGGVGAVVLVDRKQMVGGDVEEARRRCAGERNAQVFAEHSGADQSVRGLDGGAWVR